MTFEEARLIAKVIQTADGGCGHCVQELCDKLNSEFPQFRFYRDFGHDEIDERVIVENV